MPVFLLNFATSLVGPKFAKPLIFGLLGVLILGALWGGKCAYDRNVISKYENKQEVKTLRRVQSANDQAGDERINDRLREQKKEEEAHDAIHNGPDGAPGAAAVRHNCKRLRDAGTDTSRIPACGGH